MRKRLLQLIALTTVLASAPCSAAIILSNAPAASASRCPQERAKAAAQVRAAAQKPRGPTMITLQDRVMDDSSLFHFSSRGFFAP